VSEAASQARRVEQRIDRRDEGEAQVRQ